MSRYIVTDATGTVLKYGFVTDDAQLAAQAGAGQTVHTLDQMAGAIDQTVKATATVTDLDGKTWAITPPFSA